MVLLCLLVGHKPLKEAPYCKWCWEDFPGMNVLRDIQGNSEMSPETTTILDPDSLEFQVAQAKRDEAEKSAKLNDGVVYVNDDE